MFSTRFGTALCLLCLLGMTACVGTGTPLGSGSAAPVVPAPALQVFPNLAEVLRQSAAAGDDFQTQQLGSSFAADLVINRCAVAGIAADFTPQWSATGPNPFDNAAFAVYRLTYDPLDLPVTLSLEWNGTAPADADCWIGLSDWTRQTWRWQQPVAGQLDLANPAPFVDATQRCFVAVIVLGSDPVNLATIGFREPPPPVTADGYTLFAPLNSTTTYLIDMSGNVVNEWLSPNTAGAMAVLLENGHLLRQTNLLNPEFTFGGRGGGLEEYDWAGNLVWSYELNTATQCTHHDFALMPNGNILLLVSNALIDRDIIDQGRDPAITTSNANFWVDSIMEIEPTLPSGANIVWEWTAMDHLVQDFDDTKPNFDDPAVHPELIDLNFPPGEMAGDWIHANCVAYNANLDQVAMTSLHFNEFWVIDHSTTMAEAASHSGGNCGRGGDVLYRWGNPAAYRGGTVDDQEFFGCHHAHWIADGLQGAGDILVFKNGTDGQDFSQVITLTPPVNPDGTYSMTGSAYGPAAPNWAYEDRRPQPDGFFSKFMGSVERLPGGETLITESLSGTLFVVDASGAIKWEHVNQFPAPAAAVFRGERYLPDYPGLIGLP